MRLFSDEASYWAQKLLTDIKLPPRLVSDEDNNFGNSLVLDFIKMMMSHLQPNDI